MNPIINPLWFYLFEILESLDIFLMIIITFGSIILFFHIIDRGMTSFFKKGVVLIIISTFLLILTPTKDTCYKMLIAGMITPNNVELVGDTAENMVDYIIDSVDKLLEEGN